MRALRSFFAGALFCAFIASSASAQMLQAIVNAGAHTTPPSSGTTQVLTSTMTTVANNGTRFIPVGYGIGTAAGGTLSSIVFPISGSISNLRVRAPNVPTGAQSWTITLEKNGAATTLSCIITSSINPCTSAGTISVNAGDVVDFQSAPSGAPTASGIQAAVDFTSAAVGDTILMARGSSFSTSGTQATQPFSDSTPGAVSSRELNLIAENGTLSRLFVASNAPGAGTSYAYGVDINGAAVGTPSAISATISGTGTAASDTTNAASVSDGQSVQLTATPTSTPASANVGFGLRYVPLTVGDFVFMGNAARTALSSSTPQFYSLTGVSSAAEATAQSLVNSMTLTKLEVNLNFPPGTGTSYTFTLNTNGVATALSCSIADTATSCVVTGTVAVADGDLLDVSGTPVNSPSSETPFFGLVAHK